MRTLKIILSTAAILISSCHLSAQVREVRYFSQDTAAQKDLLVQDTIIEYRSNSLKYSVGTNVADWCNFGTVSGEASISILRHFTLNAGVRYNPWSFGADDSPQALQSRRRTVYFGPRLWPWNVYSGFWFALHGQYEEYNRGGLFRNPHTEEGDAFGLSAGIGYSRMLHKNWNLDIGIFGWGGKTYYKEYASPRCGKCVLDYGTKPFLRYDRLNVSFVYIFNTNKY